MSQEGDSDWEPKSLDDEDSEEVVPSNRAVTTVTVPKWLPDVPLLTISRNPVFPRFVKMLEVCPYMVMLATPTR